MSLFWSIYLPGFCTRLRFAATWRQKDAFGYLKNSWNVENKAAKDNGWANGEQNRLEFWIDTVGNVTSVTKESVTEAFWVCTPGWGVNAADADVIIVINWNPVSAAECDW